MSSFEKRIAKGAELHQRLLDYLDSQNIDYLNSGYEHLSGSKSAFKNIKYNKDTTSLFIRHYPDVSVISPVRSVLIEVKNSTGIEKECYHVYLNLKQEMKTNVLLFLRNGELCRIEDLKFSPANPRCYVSGLEIPITEGVWREPRLMNEEEYKAYLKAYSDANKYTSGCAFAFIDFHNTKTYPLECLAQTMKKPQVAANQKPAAYPIGQTNYGISA